MCNKKNFGGVVTPKLPPLIASLLCTVEKNATLTLKAVSRIRVYSTGDSIYDDGPQSNSWTSVERIFLPPRNHFTGSLWKSQGERGGAAKNIVWLAMSWRWPQYKQSVPLYHWIYILHFYTFTLELEYCYSNQWFHV